MPTCGRQEWALQAIECFLAQDYPNKELIILDDAEQPSFPGLVRESAIVKYSHHVDRLTIAEKRNRCCGLTSGEIIIHFDDDDWSAPDRISDQVKRLEESGKAVTGYCTMPFWDEQTQKPYLYKCNPNTWAVGTSLCFQKSWWAAHRFSESKYQREDNGFSNDARNAREIITVPCDGKMVARIHANNTVPKHAYNWTWKATLDDIAPGFFQCKPVS